MNERNLILTGIKRSGTTLTCHLLNKVPDVIALHEPMKVSKFAEYESREELCEAVARFFQFVRRIAHEEGKIVTRHFEGAVPANTFGDQRSKEGLRKGIGTNKGKTAIDKQVSENFLLCIKHPGAFTAVLESLAKHFPCYAVIRNPLAILASWNSVNMPVAKGHIPAAERLDENLAEKLAHTKDKYDRQIHLLAWHFEKYHAVLPKSSVFRYEDIVASGGKRLAAIAPGAASLNEPMESQNKSKRYDSAVMQTLAEKLLRTEGAMWEFYSKESVAALLD